MSSRNDNIDDRTITRRTKGASQRGEEQNMVQTNVSYDSTQLPGYRAQSAKERANSRYYLIWIEFTVCLKYIFNIIILYIYI